MMCVKELLDIVPLLLEASGVDSVRIAVVRAAANKRRAQTQTGAVVRERAHTYFGTRRAAANKSANKRRKQKQGPNADGGSRQGTRTHIQTRHTCGARWQYAIGALVEKGRGVSLCAAALLDVVPLLRHGLSHQQRCGGERLR